MRHFFTAFLAAIFILIPASADVLFFDLNLSDGEVDAAKRAAEKRHEKLLVYPQIDAKTRANYKTVIKKIADHNKLLLTSKCYTYPDTNQCQDAIKKSGILSEELSEQDKFFDGKRLRQGDLSKILEELNKKQTKISALVISGHDGNGHFSGKVGNFDEKDIAKAVNDHPPAGENLRSLFLWGCYTGTVGTLSSTWKAAFPKVEMIAGFDGSAPLGTKKASETYLEDALVQEKKLTSIKDQKQLKRAFDSIRDIKMMHASVCVGNNLVNNKGVIDITESVKICSNLDKNKVKALYMCYKNAETAKCANPPADTHNSELRDLYNQLQLTSQCYKSNFDAPDLKALIRLIYFENVKNNFINLHSESMDKLNSLLRQLGAPDEALLLDIKKSSRAEILNKLNKARDFIQKRQKNTDYLTDAFRPELEVASSALFEAQYVLGDLSTPFPWVEPDARPDANSFIFNCLKPENIQMNRDWYEGSRGQYLVRQKYLELFAATPEAQNMREITLQMEKLGGYGGPIAANGESSNVNRQQKRQSYYQLGLQYKTEEKNAVGKLKPALKSYIESLKNQEYPNEEGKKTFIRKLNENFPSDGEYKF